MLHSNQAKNLGERSKSLASLVIHKLKRRVSFRGKSGLGCQSRPSFHMRSSIYKISESSNESPEKHSSNKQQNASVNHLNRYEDNFDTTLMNKGQGGASASFNFHANQLSIWQSNISNHGERQ